ncbi:MAG: hypothetical protein ACJ8CN_17280, partial [Gemmatimonadales bacterium]
SSRTRSFRGTPWFVADTAVRRFLVALTMGNRGHLVEAVKLGRISRPDGWLNPFIDLALMGAIPAETAATTFKRLLAQGDFWPPRFGQGVALPWWSARRDTASLERFGQRAEVAARVTSNPVARSYARYLGNAAQAYLALARSDSATALRRLVALPDSACLVNHCFFEKFTQAQLYVAQGRDQEGGKVLDQWLHTRDHSLLFIVGTLQRGRIAERLGDSERAMRSYQYVANVWRHADPELQAYVSEAVGGLARLSGENKR